ncbi:MAG: phenylalanine--tRNA ligase beta subunit-related protein [Candidatus Hadarchaeales archaeon]
MTSLYPGFFCGYALVTGLTVETSVEALEGKVRELVESYRGREGALEGLLPYIEFLKRMGVEETSFPLKLWMERILKGEFPGRNNNVLDSCVLASLEHLVPLSPFDLLKLKGEVEVTLSAGDRPLILQDGSKVVPPAGEVILRDQERILSSYSRGEGTVARVGFETSGVIFVAWNAPGIPRQKVEEVLKAVATYARRYCGGHVEKTEVLG